MALCGLVVFPSCANDLPTPNTGEVYWNTTQNELRVYSGTNWAAWTIAGAGINGGSADITGGDQIVCNLYEGVHYACHIFYNSGTIELGGVNDQDDVYIFAISGGGGGGTNVGGGGGGATFAFGPSNQICSWAGPYSFKSSVATSYSVTVGAGGSAGADGGQTEVELVMAPSSPPNLCAGTPNTLITFIPCSLGGGGSTENGASPGNGGAAGCCSAGAPLGGCCPVAYPLAGKGGPYDTPGQTRTSGGGGAGLYWNCTSWVTRGGRALNVGYDGSDCYYGGVGARGFCHPDFNFLFGGGGAGTSHIGASPASPTIPQPLVQDNNNELRVDGDGGCGGISGFPNTGPSPTGGSAGACTGAGGGGGAWTGVGGNGGSGFVVIRRLIDTP